MAAKTLREGIYLARIHDDEFELQVPEGFQPRAYCRPTAPGDGDSRE